MAKIIMLEEGAVATTPSAGMWKLYFKAGGLYILDDVGTETLLATGGGVSDGDKGDITASSSGTVWTIDAGVVTLAKMADMATASLIGRNTGGTGVPEVLSASTVRTLLGLVIGTNVQAWDADLDYLAGFTPTANVKSILNAADYAAIKTLLSLTIGTNVQAWDADLDTIASLTATTDNFIVSVASAWASRTAAQVKTTLALSSADSPQFTGIEIGHATDTTITRSAAGILAVEGVVIPSISSTNTLTNKRITKRTGTTTSHATPTINTDNVDFYSLTAQAEAITSFTTNLSGTPTEGQTLWIAITGTAARAITWGSSFEASTVALPTTTVTTARLDVGFAWNSVTSKWRCLASA